MNRAVAQPEAMTTRAVPRARIRSFLRLPEPDRDRSTRDRGRSTAIAVCAPVPMPTSAGERRPIPTGVERLPSQRAVVR
jgi:hypothetical protein